jgi:hypothetical protein
MGIVIKAAKPYFRRITKFNREAEFRRKIEIFLLELSPLAKTSHCPAVRHRVGVLIFQVLLIAEQSLG